MKPGRTDRDEIIEKAGMLKPQTNSHRKRRRGKVFTAADSTPIQARIPNAMFLEIERAARDELISIADFVRAALLENSNGSETKIKLMFDCSLMRIQSNHQSASGTTVRRQPHLGGLRLLRPRHFLDGARSPALTAQSFLVAKPER